MSSPIQTTHLMTAIAYASRSYTLQVDGRVHAGNLARYLAQHESYVQATTLEIAYPILPKQRLHDLDLQSGDRLVLFLQADQPTKPPASIRAGDYGLVLSRGEVRISSGSKTGLLLGKPDEQYRSIPDFDVRHFIAPDMLDFVSRGCLWFYYDRTQQVWFATRMGDTRIMIDEFELGTEKIALNGDCRLRFYRPIDNPLIDPAIGEAQVTIEPIKAEQFTALPSGNHAVPIQIGTERPPQRLHSSGNVPIGQMMTSLALHNFLALNEDVRPYLLRLLPPQLPLSRIPLPEGAFLYVPQQLAYAHNVLILKDTRQQSYRLQSGLVDETKLIGFHQAIHGDTHVLDVDLTESLVRRHPLPPLPLRQALLDYRASENGWYIRTAVGSPIPIFINNTRLTHATRLLSGDVLTMGTSIQDYLLRLEVSLRATQE